MAKSVKDVLLMIKENGVKMEKPSFNEEASFGAMLYGLIAIGKFSTVSDVQQLIKYER